MKEKIKKISKKGKRFKKMLGDYEPIKIEKGVNETVLSDKKVNPLKEGDIYWMVDLKDGGGYYDCETQTEAEILSRLIRIENLLKKIVNRENKSKMDMLIEGSILNKNLKKEIQYFIDTLKNDELESLFKKLKNRLNIKEEM